MVLAGAATAILIASNSDQSGYYEIVMSTMYGPSGSAICQETAASMNRNGTYEIITRSKQPVIFSCKPFTETIPNTGARM